MPSGHLPPPRPADPRGERDLPAGAVLEGIFASAGVGLCLVDAEGRIARANAGWLESVGRGEEDVLGRDVWEVLPEPPPQARALKLRVRAGEVVDLPERSQVVGGRERWYAGRLSPVPFQAGTGVLVTTWEVTAARTLANEALRASDARARAVTDSAGDHLVVLEPIRDSAGAVVDWRYVDANDRTLELFGRSRGELLARTLREVLGDERATRRSEERFRRLGEVSSQIVWVTDAEGNAVEDSPSWRAFTGRSYEEWAGARWLEAVHPEDRDRLAAAWRLAVETRGAHHVEFRLLHATGQYRHIESRAAPIYDEDGGVREWVGMNVDITDRKRAEEALRAANERLRETDRRKDEFLAMLSHELRNPLAPIRNAVAILDRASPAGAQAARAKAVIGRQVDHLARLVDDLLDVTRIARGKIELRREPLDLVAVVRRAAEDHRPLLYERGIALAVEVPGAPAWVRGDATRLTQVLGNLLQNAAKFTERGGRVTVTLEGKGDDVEVRVRDTGVGVEPALLARIFEPFVQADVTLARTQGGLGLGLALVKGITELHGGSVAAASGGLGQGAELTIRLPREAAPASAGQDATGASRSARRRVLVVDDNRDAAESLAEVLSLLGHEAEVAYDGPSAIARARSSRPDVVLCDIGLPGMSGYDVARELRAAQPGPVKLFAVSGYARPEDVERAREAGFDGHVAKPPDPDVLLRLLGT